MGHILFVGEGVTDVGAEGGPSAVQTTAPRDGSDEGRPRGVIPILVLRVLACARCQPSLRLAAKSRFLRRMHGRGFARKVKAAMVDAVRDRAIAVVVVADRGGERNRKRLEEMKKGRDDAAQDGINVPAALGLAVEELEAWLLADETAISATTGMTLAGALPDPESDNNPKSTLSRLYSQATARKDRWRLHEAIADGIDLDSLARRCPRGFSPFQQEILERLSHLAGS